MEDTEHHEGPHASRSRFFFVGNNLAIDLVNTEIVSGDERIDLLASFSDAVEWLSDAGVIEREEATELRSRWNREAGDAALAGIREFRRAFRTGLEEIAAGQRIGDGVLQAINDRLAAPVRRTRIVRAQSGGFEIESSFVFGSPADLLAPVAESARELLGTGDLRLVKKCKNPKCILYFYDSTKNHRRSWCSMSACGNRTKVAAHYRRHRASAV
jgi:predicted RNA-binding Zn ribbon-like protein